MTATHGEVARNGSSATGLLQVRDMTVAFGGVTAVNGLTFDVHEGEVLSVIGPNGAGKTSAFNCITGFYKPSAGQVTFDGSDITGKRPAVIAARGVARTFQNLRLFGDLSVLDNVRAGMHVRIRQNALDAVLHTPGTTAASKPRQTRRIAGSTSSERAGAGSTKCATCPTASSAASRSPGPWPVNRRCSCSTSPRPA